MSGHIVYDRNGIDEQMQIAYRKTGSAARPPSSSGNWISVQVMGTLQTTGTGARPPPSYVESAGVLFRPGSRIRNDAKEWGDSHPQRTIGGGDWSIGYGHVTAGLNLAHCRVGDETGNKSHIPLQPRTTCTRALHLDKYSVPRLRRSRFPA